MHYKRFQQYLKITAICTIFLFINSFYIAPTAFAITVEEIAGSKGKNKSKNKDNTIGSFYGKKVIKRKGSVTVMKKDPRLSCILSLIVPGSGHIYLRKDLKGVGFCLAAGAAYGAAGYYAYDSFAGSGKDSSDNSKLIITGLIFFIAAIIHVVGIIESYNDAETINKEGNFSNRKDDNPFLARLIIEE